MLVGSGGCVGLGDLGCWLCCSMNGWFGMEWKSPINKEKEAVLGLKWGFWASIGLKFGNWVN